MVACVRAELEVLGGGRLAVIAPRLRVAPIHEMLAGVLEPGVVATGTGALDAPVAVLAVHQVKGLEFDAVVLLEPAQILADSARGANDLYVAITRPTQTLRVMHSEPLPAGLDTLTDAMSRR